MPSTDTAVWIGDHGVLSLDELALACGTDAEWIVELVNIGILVPKGRGRSDWRFAAPDLARARKLMRLSRDFDTNLETAAVILDLLEETDRLRARLRRAGLPAE
jgi:chaperone modulatory protein CbpM